MYCWSGFQNLPDLWNAILSAFNRQRAHFEEEVIIMLSDSQTMASLKYQSSGTQLHHKTLLNVSPQLHSDTRNHWPISHSTESNCSWVFGVLGAFALTIQCTCTPSGMASSVCDPLDIIIGLPEWIFWHKYWQPQIMLWDEEKWN